MRQKLWRVQLPSARPTLMVGVNQVIMLALNMVIISSMIGAGGLGYDVLLALRALKVGNAMEAGLAIVAIAIALDRVSQAMAALWQMPVLQAIKPGAGNCSAAGDHGFIACNTGICQSAGRDHHLDRTGLERCRDLGDDKLV